MDANPWAKLFERGLRLLALLDGGAAVWDEVALAPLELFRAGSAGAFAAFDLGELRAWFWAHGLPEVLARVAPPPPPVLWDCPVVWEDGRRCVASFKKRSALLAHMRSVDDSMHRLQSPAVLLTVTNQ